jgi:hypothetical protein
VIPHPFSLKPHLGALADGLGYFPFARGTYLSRTDSLVKDAGIRSLIGVGTAVTALALSVLYLRHSTREAIPKNISGSTSYLRV